MSNSGNGGTPARETPKDDPDLLRSTIRTLAERLFPNSRYPDGYDEE
ncbi:hypothetical protein [Microbacterium sp. MPKO10]|nr:hypothetical protein [Microbacterium sp. MPKO10]MCW4458200.1 hypothetical protein [Microbacterium sp. MPKO10]